MEGKTAEGLWESLDLSRRRFLLVLAGGTAAILGGCDETDLRKMALKLVSQEEIRQLGLETWRRIRSEIPASRDASLQRRLERISERVIRASGVASNDWEFVVFRSDEINAFAVPGGKIGVFEGMFLVAENDAQIAAVLGHEIGHINAQHAAERIAAAFAKQVGINVVLAALKAGDVEYANEIAALLGVGVEYGVILPYSRRHEYEADRLGTEYMTRAGYPPEEALAFWLNMMALSRGRPKPLEFLSTHPSDEKRMAALREVIQALPKALESER